jgi:hypothetical protein
MSEAQTVFGWCCIMGGTAYPCTIVPARYGGVYEGAPWLAFPCDPDAIPDGWDGGDPECAGFFAEYSGAPIGRGGSPDWAHQNLIERLRRTAPTPTGGPDE